MSFETTTRDPGVYCTAQVDPGTEEILGYSEDPSLWHFVCPLTTYAYEKGQRDINEIHVAGQVKRHCRQYGEAHIKYLTIVTASGNVHHHIYKGGADELRTA